MKILKLRKQAKLSQDAADKCLDRFSKSLLPYYKLRRAANADDFNYKAELREVLVKSLIGSLVGCAISLVGSYIVVIVLTLLEIHG